MSPKCLSLERPAWPFYLVRPSTLLSHQCLFVFILILIIMGNYIVPLFLFTSCVGVSHHGLSSMRQGSCWPWSLLNTSSHVPCPQCPVQCLTQNLGLEMFIGCMRKAVTPSIQWNLQVISSAPGNKLQKTWEKRRQTVPLGLKIPSTALSSPVFQGVPVSKGCNFFMHALQLSPMYIYLC